MTLHGLGDLYTPQQVAQEIAWEDVSMCIVIYRDKHGSVKSKISTSNTMERTYLIALLHAMLIQELASTFTQRPVV